MEHRYSTRVAAGKKLLMYKKGIPVAIGRIMDVSRHGIFVATDYSDVGPHQVLEVEFTLRHFERTERCRFRCIVARVDEEGIGLELDDSSDEGYEALRSLVETVSDSGDIARLVFASSA